MLIRKITQIGKEGAQRGSDGEGRSRLITRTNVLIILSNNVSELSRGFVKEKILFTANAPIELPLRAPIELV